MRQLEWRIQNGKSFLTAIFPLINAGSQISASPLVSVTHLNVALIRIVTTFYQQLNHNAYETRMQTIKQCNWQWKFMLKFVFQNKKWKGFDI